MSQRSKMAGTITLGGQTLASHDTASNTITLENVDKAVIGTNVGIGTTQNDFAKVEIKTGNFSTSQAQDGIVLKLQTNEGDTAHSYGITLETNDVGVPQHSLLATDSPTLKTRQPFIQSVGVSTNQYTRFLTAGVERMRINGSGHLLVGTTAEIYSSDAPVHIKQTDTNTGNNGCLALQNMNAAGSSGVRTIVFINSSGSINGIISNTNSATSYSTSSDYRLKENITKITDGITRVKQLNPSRFNFIVEPDRTVDGFIAHEVSDIVPEAINGEKDAVNEDGSIDPQGIDQSKLIPLLTAALQEALVKIEQLETRVIELENK